MEIVSATKQENIMFFVVFELNKFEKCAKQLKKETAIILLRRETKADNRENEAVAPNK